MSVEGDVNFSAARARWQEKNLGSASRQLLEKDAEVFLHQALSTPCLNAIVSSKGSYIVDMDGRKYLDFHGNSVHQIGHGHPRVIQAIKETLDTLPFSPRRYTNAYAVELAQRLGDLAPGKLNKVLFAPGGTAAIGIALKLARVATGRFKTVSMWDSFHGASLDAISVGGEEQFRRGVGPLLTGAEHVPPPDPRRCPLLCGSECSLACASYLSYVLDHEGDVAAVVAEPIRCTTAVAPPKDYWRRVREACDRNGTLLIFDEIPSALGRTGTMFASELTGVVPDMIVLGKGLGGGMFPIAALIAHEDLDVADEVSIGHYTHEKSSVGTAAALATLDVIESESLLERSLEMGRYLVDRLNDLKIRHPIISEVRGMGLLVGVELRDPYIAESVMYSALDHGLSFKVSSGSVLTLTPPLTVSQEEIDCAVRALDSALTSSVSS